MEIPNFPPKKEGVFTKNSKYSGYRIISVENGYELFLLKKRGGFDKILCGNYQEAISIVGQKDS